MTVYNLSHNLKIEGGVLGVGGGWTRGRVWEVNIPPNPNRKFSYILKFTMSYSWDKDFHRVPRVSIHLE